jgi:hypothetical protein
VKTTFCGQLERWIIEYTATVQKAKPKEHMSTNKPQIEGIQANNRSVYFLLFCVDALGGIGGCEGRVQQGVDVCMYNRWGWRVVLPRLATRCCAQLLWWNARDGGLLAYVCAMLALPLAAM